MFDNIVEEAIVFTTFGDKCLGSVSMLTVFCQDELAEIASDIIEGLDITLEETLESYVHIEMNGFRREKYYMTVTKVVDEEDGTTTTGIEFGHKDDGYNRSELLEILNLLIMFAEED